LLFIPSENKNAMRWTALVVSGRRSSFRLWVFSMFDASNPDLQMEARYNWITVAGWNIQYYLGVDGLSILLVLLTTLPHADLDPLHVDGGGGAREGLHDLLPAAGSGHDGRVPRAGPVPVLHLLGIHPRPDVLPHRHLGRTAPHLRRVKFFLYTMAGSILMLLAILWLGIQAQDFRP
jgi:NADH-quinone oxidoreductase subunit M